MRKQIVAGNWKMNLLRDEAWELINGIREELDNHTASPSEYSDLVVIPPFPWLRDAVDLTRNEDRISVGAQNCHYESKGAFTGEVSPDMLSSAGSEYVIIGHSERRQNFSEGHQMLKKKVASAIEKDLSPIFCCGEPLEVREENTHQEWIEKQLNESLFHLSNENFQKVIIAYEPIWAIGTGKTASPEQAQEMHAYIRRMVRENYGDRIAKDTSILYGGSVKSANAQDLFSQEDIDGGLIGGASLKVQDFIKIYYSF